MITFKGWHLPYWRLEGFPRHWGGARLCGTAPPAPSADTPSASWEQVPLRTTTHSALIDKSARCCLRRRRLRPLRSPGSAANLACPACALFLGPCRIPAAPRPPQRSRQPCRPMSAAPAYNEDKGGSAGPGEPEYGHDPASGGIFSSDYKR